jgi:hypothetical protein
MEGQTKGLLLTGGEPTLAPTFPEVLRMAREHGFIDVAVVTNGSFLGREEVGAALLAHASAVRVSIYDWAVESCAGLDLTLDHIETLRSSIDKERSALQIGVSILTSKENVDGLPLVGQKAMSAGAHWVYFHPMCTKWGTGSPARVSQEGVLARIQTFEESQPDRCGVFVCGDRYVDTDLTFNGYHAAHFLLVVGADGMNYLGAEVKYQPRHIIADLNGTWHNDLLWQSQRLDRIASVSSKTYPAIRSRHRGVLYNDFIEGLKGGRGGPLAQSIPASTDGFMFPHIL